MQIHGASAGEMLGRRLIIAATFTAEPVLEPLRFWVDELGLLASIEFAPYDQVFQQLLDRDSPLSRNHDGINVVLVRVEDWTRSQHESARVDDLEDFLKRNAVDLIDAAQARRRSLADSADRWRLPWLAGDARRCTEAGDCGAGRAIDRE